MDEQYEMQGVDSNIVKLGFCKCEDCEDEPICPHAGHRRGCRTKETIKELRINFLWRKKKMPEKMSFEDMISQLDGACGRLITSVIINPAARKALEMIKKVSISLREWAQNLDDNPKWIPCSERLPECEDGNETEALLFQLASGVIEAGYYGVGGAYRDKYFRVYRDAGEGFDARDVVAWMPLPEPYKLNL